MTVPTLRQRASGILLHPTSLPGPHGSGDLGAAARRFVDFLSTAKQRWWQMLPVGPPGYGESPYSAESAFAGNPLLVSPESLADARLLDAVRLAPAEPLRADRIEFSAMEAHRTRLLRAAFQAFEAHPERRTSFVHFCQENSAWLDDFALFRALKEAHGRVQWTRWQTGVRKREPRALEVARKELEPAVAFEKFAQYQFDQEWRRLRAYAAELGIGLIGDLPIFVAHDSADVWSHPEAFSLDDEGEPTYVAGVPPDYFSATGRRWGNPLYRWRRMKKTAYAWWNDPGGSDSTRSPAQVRAEHQRALSYLATDGKEIHWDMIRAAMSSVARLALVPMQDVLGLGSHARMNRPGKEQGNWAWRLAGGELTAELAARLALLAQTYGRHVPDSGSGETA